MTQHEQARLKVLNSLLADHMTIDQAATLMGVSTRHTSDFWRLTGRKGQPHSLTVTAVGDHPTSHRRRRGLWLYIWLALVIRAPTTRISANCSENTR
ncbi:MAG: hypothetical protein OXC95_00550, partial [Dehalococcoidia bacterium]|nr:hypothetical protein [Dehalococcoidia bacterium]